jgi:transcriptional regulator with XRE-family HTH domain
VPAILPSMNEEAIGRSMRALRLRHGWRQADLGRRVGIGQPAISAVERGDLGTVSTRTLGRLFAELGADLVVTVRWRGGELDRLLDRAHAALVEWAARLLVRLGWEVLLEVSFARYGERGSVDVLGWHASTRTLLIVEVKGEIASVEETLRRHDVKVRLGPHIAFERLGQRPAHVARLLVAPGTAATRRRLAEHAVTFDRSYPQRGMAVRRWLARPSGPMAGILLAGPAAGSATRRRQRVSSPTPARVARDRRRPRRPRSASTSPGSDVARPDVQWLGPNITGG